MNKYANSYEIDKSGDKGKQKISRNIQTSVTEREIFFHCPEKNRLFKMAQVLRLRENV
jgi:hypothetical protein